MIRAGFLLAGFLGGIGLTGYAQESREIELIDADPVRFDQHWREQGFPLIKPTEYSLRIEGETPIITGRSDGANRALLRECLIAAPEAAQLRWRWRVLEPLPGAISERTKAGDDFVARVFVVFETSRIPTRTRAINYVWASQEPSGSVFASPYTKNVAHIVLRSARDGDGPDQWRREERDVLADYAAFFGEPATVITAAAIMVDADNTDQSAAAEFTELYWEIEAAGEISCP